MIIGSRSMLLGDSVAINTWQAKLACATVQVKVEIKFSKIECESSRESTDLSGKNCWVY